MHSRENSYLDFKKIALEEIFIKQPVEFIEFSFFEKVKIVFGYKVAIYTDATFQVTGGRLTINTKFIKTWQKLRLKKRI